MAGNEGDALKFVSEDDVKLGWESWFDNAVKRCIASPDFSSFSLAVDMLEAFVVGFKLRISGTHKVPLSLQGKEYPAQLQRYYDAIKEETDKVLKDYGEKDSNAKVPIYKYKFVLLLSMIRSVTPDKVTVDVGSEQR